MELLIRASADPNFTNPDFTHTKPSRALGDPTLGRVVGVVAEDIITKVQRGRATLHQIETPTDH
jgi:hypothetical protein